MSPSPDPGGPRAEVGPSRRPLTRSTPSVPDAASAPPDPGGADPGGADPRSGPRVATDPPVADERSSAGGPAGSSALAVTALTLGGLAVLLGATLVWFFLALPFGLVAVGCALVDRRRTRARTGRPAGGIVTAGLVLGLAAVPLSLGGLVVLPRAHDFVGDSVTDANGVVSGDLDQVERSFHQQVDDLDRTLTRNVDASTRSLSSDFDQLETDSQREIAASEARLNALLAQLQKDAKSDTSTLEKSLRADLATEQLVIQRIETDLRNDLANTKAEVAELRARLDAAG